MTSPVRIQRKRVKGWKMPESTIYVGRGSQWGNPHMIGAATILTGGRAGQKTNADDVVDLFEFDTKRALNAPDLLQPLGGKNLACWCPLDQPCHADSLLKLANGA